MKPIKPSMTTALLLGGGGSRGVIEAGFYKALSEVGVPIDMIFGTSVGALNGAFIAAGFTPEKLEAFWSRMEGKRLFRRMPDHFGSVGRVAPASRHFLGGEDGAASVGMGAPASA